jgi:hypothetical protein
VEKRCTAEEATNGNIGRRVRIALWITKVTDTHSVYVIFITLLSQQLLHERDLVLRCYVTRPLAVLLSIDTKSVGL